MKMNHTGKYYAKRYGIPAAVLITLIALLYWMSHVYYTAKEAALTRAAAQVCAEAPFFNGKIVQITGIIHGKKHTPYNAVFFSAKYKGMEAVLAAIPLHGKYGVYSGLFLYEEQTGCIFCGLMGVSNKEIAASYYGITDTIIERHREKIHLLLAKGKKQHEK